MRRVRSEDIRVGLGELEMQAGERNIAAEYAPEISRLFLFFNQGLYVVKMPKRHDSFFRSSSY